MTTPYARLSDLGEIDLTFDQEDAPETPKQRRKSAAEPTRDELEIDKRRRRAPPAQRAKGKAPPSSRRRNAPPENDFDTLDDDGFTRPSLDNRPNIEDRNLDFDPPTERFVGGTGQNQPPFGWTDVDNALYGGPMAAPLPPPPPPPKKNSVEDFLPYVAGILILGAATFFVIKAKTKNSGGDSSAM